MPRGLTSGMKALLAEEGVFPLWFVSIDLASTPVGWWTGVGITEQLGKTWYGVGEHGAISGIQSSREIRSHEITLGIMGVPSSVTTPSILQATRDETYQGRELNIHISAADMNNGTPQLPPEIIWSGFADTTSMRYGKQVSLILSAEHLSSHLSRQNGARATTESHNQRLGNPATRDIFFDAQSRLAGRPRPLVGN